MTSVAVAPDGAEFDVEEDGPGPDGAHGTAVGGSIGYWAIVSILGEDLRLGGGPRPEVIDDHRAAALVEILVPNPVAGLLGRPGRGAVEVQGHSHLEDRSTVRAFDQYHDGLRRVVRFEGEQ